jgi:hypothetical protein
VKAFHLTLKAVAMVLLAFTQFLKKASRQCSVRLVSLTAEFIAFCSLRSGNCTHKDCSMQRIIMTQITGRNFFIGFCTCVMKENILLILLFGRSDKATFEGTGTVNSHNCENWATEN